MHINFKAVGASLLISGTMLGAGMLALPLISEAMGFQYTLLVLLVIWLIMTYTGLMLLEVCMAFPVGTGFEAIANALFGQRITCVINGCLLLLLYSLSGAYIAGAASTYDSNLVLYFHVHLSPALISVGFTLVIGIIVCIGTNLVDKVNRLLLTLNILLFVLMINTMQPYVQTHYLFDHSGAFKYIFATLPVFVTAFGFHGSIPSIIKYVGNDDPKRLRKIFLFGTSIPLIVYIIWEYSTLGLLPKTGAVSFKTVIDHGSSLGLFLNEIHLFVKSNTVPILFSIFSSTALFTSYLCVSLGLFDAITSTLNFRDCYQARFKTALITYFPPLLFALCYPQGFIVALGAAAIFLAILAIIFPAGALLKLRSQPDYLPSYRLQGGRYSYWIILWIGVLIILLQFLKINNLLPVL